VNTFFRQGIEEALPSPGVFDHVIVAIEIENKRYFVDPADSSQRGPLHLRFLPDYEGDGRLTITTEGAAERLRNFFAGNSRE